jgi:hypothetical protein
MRILNRRKLLLVGSYIATGLPLWGQQIHNPERQTGPVMEVAVLYNPLLSNVVAANRFWMQGGSIQVNAHLWHGWGVMADVSGLHAQNANSSGVGLDLVTSTFGPRYRWSPPSSRFAFFGHALAGRANGFNSLFPGAIAATSSASSLALQIGGGIDLPMKHRLSLRAFEADWLRTQLPNSTTNVQNNLRLAVGLAVRFP